MKYLLVIFVFILLFLGCRKDKVFFETTPYALEIPSHFPQMQIPTENQLTEEGVLLGRFLFYEKRLSGDNSQSCASCHSPLAAFSDPNQYSTGIDGIQGDRNSMALINLGWQTFFFWDGREKTLEEQILQPVINPIEMHESWKNAINKLKADEKYRNLFFRAFNTQDFDSTHASKAIAQFLRTLVSATSKYDIMYKSIYGFTLTPQENTILASVTPDEWAGYDLFKSLNGADCFHCHNGPLMQINTFSNNGLDANPLDFGRELVTNNPNDRAKFKVPTLRNIEFSAPYMHDGRFATLEEVINHYSSGIQMSATIDPNIEYASQGGVQLDATQKSLLKKFLLTLTDHEFINNPKFQDPN